MTLEDLIFDVRALKQHLNQGHGLPLRFRQQLLFHGQRLEDTATLHSGMELELVKLAFIPSPSVDEVQKFTAAAGTGDFDKVRALSQIPNAHSEQITECPGIDISKLKFPSVFPDFRLSPC